MSSNSRKLVAIICAGAVAVVLLSFLYWAWSFHASGYAPVPSEPTSSSQEVEYAFDEASCEDAMLTLKGYLLYAGDTQWSSWTRKKLWLVDEEDGTTYQVALRDTFYTYENLPEGLNSRAYQRCGFELAFDLSSTSLPDSTYRLVLAYQRWGTTFTCETELALTIDGERCSLT